MDDPPWLHLRLVTCPLRANRFNINQVSCMAISTAVHSNLGLSSPFFMVNIPKLAFFPLRRCSNCNSYAEGL
jgi:hypothetical protein